MKRKLFIVGEYNGDWETHRATDAALVHSQQQLGVLLNVSWHSTKDLTTELLEKADGFWIATGTPYRKLRGALDVIRFTRENKVPCFATCQGFQHLMLEFAETFLGISDPGHAEYGGDAKHPFISELACSLKGQTQPVTLLEKSLTGEIYQASTTTESFYCSYGINPEFVPRIREGGILISGVDRNGEIRVVEYPEHPFMIGTLFVPQVRSREGKPHPLVSALVEAVHTAE